jgi:hypothetical protein
MKIIPWIISAILAVLLLLTNLPGRLWQGQPTMPAIWLQYPEDSFTLLHSGDKSAVWLVKSKEGFTKRLLGNFSGNNGGSSGYLITCNRQSVAAVKDGSFTACTMQGERTIAKLPHSNKIYDNVRSFYYYDPNEKLDYTLLDLDGNGIVDAKLTTNEFWIYKHGQFVLADPNNRKECTKVVKMLNGSCVTLHEGHWIAVEEKDSNMVVH